MIKNIRGFTLIELLVVVAVIGVLSAIAVPMFKEYKERAYNTGVRSLTANLMRAEEAYYVDNESYLDCGVDNGVSTCGALPGMGDVELAGYSGRLLPGNVGLMVASCNTKAPKGYVYVTDPDMPFYTSGNMLEINVAPGECSLAMFSVE